MNILVLKGAEHMLNDYMNNFQNIVSSIFFVGFKVMLIILVTLLMFSLIMLSIGCLIKSQKIKSKFLTSSMCLLFGNIFFLCIPFFVVYIKNLI